METSREFHQSQEKGKGSTYSLTQPIHKRTFGREHIKRELEKLDQKKKKMVKIIESEEEYKTVTQSVSLPRLLRVNI